MHQGGSTRNEKAGQRGKQGGKGGRPGLPSRTQGPSIHSLPSNLSFPCLLNTGPPRVPSRGIWPLSHPLTTALPLDLGFLRKNTGHLDRHLSMRWSHSSSKPNTDGTRGVSSQLVHAVPQGVPWRTQDAHAALCVPSRCTPTNTACSTRLSPDYCVLQTAFF